MTNRNKTKGDKAERATTAALTRLGFPHAQRTRPGFHRDWGDVNVAPGLVAQVKAWASYEWGKWFTGLAQQTTDAGADHGFLVLRRPGMSDERGEEFIVAMRLDAFTRLLRQAGYGEPVEKGEAS